MSKKRRKRRKKVVTLPKGIRREPQWDSFLNLKKVNQLWDWKTLEDVKF